MTGVQTCALPILGPASLQFATTTIGSESAAQGVVFTNSGEVPVTIKSVTVTGDFTRDDLDALEAGIRRAMAVTDLAASASDRRGRVIATQFGA